jgi:hypothetical protein
MDFEDIANSMKFVGSVSQVTLGWSKIPHKEVRVIQSACGKLRWKCLGLDVPH